MDISFKNESQKQDTNRTIDKSDKKQASSKQKIQKRNVTFSNPDSFQ